jgi:hypothetical protein
MILVLAPLAATHNDLGQTGLTDGSILFDRISKGLPGKAP